VEMNPMEFGGRREEFPTNPGRVVLVDGPLRL